MTQTEALDSLSDAAGADDSLTWEAFNLEDGDEDRVLAPQTACEAAASFLRSMIFTGRLTPGEKLPSERELAERLDISRVTLRLALQNLEGAGYIVTTRGRNGGSRVNTVDGLLRCWERWIDFHRDELEDMLEFRMAVEAKTAALAARRRTADELRAIDAAIAREQDGTDRASLVRANTEIHRAIARAAHSSRFVRASAAARGEMFSSIDQSLREGREPEVHSSHCAIVEAIREQDEARAAELMTKHIEEVRSSLARELEASRLGSLSS
jgi:GntR family transcriptional regulator, transcriptional repressor for pyruvate dehydrogenase complex